MARLLDQIDSPAELKNILSVELNELAQEIREELISTVSMTGGHLASSLGTVELTIALHRVFDSPRDKIIWDVGHQAYTHKLLTGRRGKFHTLRQYGGISGFPVRTESPHDAFGTGHASTSISAALGMAVGRDLDGEDFHVIAVIGDGSITGGMALEALNNAAHLGSRLIVVLNDNGMSISPTIGGLARLLRRVRFDHRYYKATQSGMRLIRSLPFGRKLVRWISQAKTGFKSLIMPTMLWEELGFTYMGPIDGHNITDLESALTQAQHYRHKPILVHVATTKGKGYAPAEDDAVCFHGVSPRGHAGRSATTYSQVFASTMQKLMREDPKVVVITPAMPEGNCLTDVQREFPRRVFDVGICEQHAVTFAAGLAAQGFRPVVAIYSTFLQRSFDQIIHDVCLQKLPVTFALDRGGIVGDDGKTHQGTFDLSYLSLIPELAIAAPSDENELQHLLFTAVYSGQPMAVRYPRGTGLGVVIEPAAKLLPLGLGEIIRPGEDLAILAIGATVAPSITAAEVLASQGINASVVNCRFLKPLDTELIVGLAGHIKKLVIVEENTLTGGLNSAVLAAMQQAGLTDIKTRAIGIPDEFVTHGTQSLLRAKYNLDSSGIVTSVIDFFPEFRPENEPSKKAALRR